MNGESVFGWMKAIGALLVMAFIGFMLWQIVAFLKKYAATGDAHNAIGSAADSVVSAVVGRETTVGGEARDLAASPVVNPVGWLWRHTFGTLTPDDVDYSGPVTPGEIDMVNKSKRDSGADSAYLLGW